MIQMTSGRATLMFLIASAAFCLFWSGVEPQFIDSSDLWPGAGPEVVPLRAQQPVLAPLPPPNFAQLAKSPASSLLASEFFASERQRLASSANKPTSALFTPHNNLSLAFSEPVFSSTLDGAFRLDEYHPLEEIYGFVEALARRYRNKVRVFQVGRTAEGRPIKALELINNGSDPDYVWLDALTHAREWITGTSLLYTIDRLVAGPASLTSGETSANQLVNYKAFTKNFIIIPVVNPDGYAYTWTTNRMWRKNRSKSQQTAASQPTRDRDSARDRSCLGADLNRNYGHSSFGGEGASSDPCSHIYAGPRPFSELETRALADLMWSLRDRIKFYLTMHSFNQLWACPYAHTVDPSAHLQTHLRVLRSIQRAVYETEGVHYEIGPLSTSLYVGSGFGIDFAYDQCGIVHSYLVELRDKGANGFVLPADQIMPTARETFAGLRAGLRVAFS